MIRMPLTVFAASLLILVACDRNKDVLPKTGENQQQKTFPTEGTQDQVSESERGNYLEATRQQIDRLQHEIDALTLKAKNSSADLRVQAEKEIQGFQKQLNATEKKLQDIKDASATTWEEMKNSLNDSIEKLRQAIHKASG